MGPTLSSKWVLNLPLHAKYANRLVIASDPDILVKDALCNNHTNITFLCNLSATERSSREVLLLDLGQARLYGNMDVIRWDLEASSNFSMKWTYAKLFPGPQISFTKALWATSVPLKVCIFLWQESKDRLRSALNVQKLHGSGNASCALCGPPEDVDHILFLCALAKFLWSRVRESFSCNWDPRSFNDILTLLRVPEVNRIGSLGAHLRP